MITIQKAREILGDKAKNMSDDDISRTLALMDILANSWLDDYERKIFNGKTIRELVDNSA